MDRKLKISLIIIAGVLGFAYAAFLFIVPALINPENYSGDIKTAVKEACGLEIEPGTLKVRTYPDLSAGVTAENTQLFIPGNEQPSLKVGKAGVKVKLLPLLFKRLEFAEVYVNNPEISVIKLKNGKYDIENAIKIPEQDKVEDEIAAQKKNESDIKLVFDGIDIIVRDYKVNLTDKSGAKAQTAGLKGELIRISEFQPDKFIKIATKGEFLVGQEPRITYDIKFSNETSPEMSTEEALPEENTQTGRFDPLEGILKYNLKADIKADLKLKNGKNPKDSGYIKGFLDFDKLSFTIDGKPLPDSYGKFKFAGKKLDIDSKLFITPASFIAITGNVNDIDKQDIDLNVKSSDINLNDIKRFAYSLADAVKADTKVLNDIGLAGSLKADFNVKKNNYQGYLNLKNVQISHKELSQPLKNLNSNVQFGKNKIVFENTAGYLGDIRFDVVGDISQKLVADVKVLAPAVNCATVYGIVNNSKLFADLKPQLKDINSVSGLVNAEVHIKGDLNKEVLPQIKLTPDNVRAYYVPSKLPVSIVSGTITTDTKNTKLKSLSLKVSESPVKVKGEISDKKGVQDINITIDGKLLNSDVAKYLPADVKKSLKANANMPFDAVISGKPDDLNVSAQIDVDNLTPGLAINHPKGTSIIASINANVKPKVVSFKNSGLFTATNTLKTKDGRYDLTSVPKLVVLEGGISGIDTSNPTLNNIKADISGFDISLLEPKGKLQINGNLVITGKSISPKATGTLSVRNIDIPSMQLTGKTVDLALKESEILANIDLIDIAGSKFAANAALNNNLALPLQVKSAKVTSEFADLDKLSAVMQAAAVQTSSPKTKKKGNSVAVSHSVGPQDVPVLIKSGTFTAQKLITAGFPVENVFCEFFIDRINELKV
ncbi:MAG: AsmA family protein, partial [Candidatus Gastranaerophilales bacterium]|nr:AsmA family protein [Candidatus Gastranaerophilales bacterium]